MDQRDFVGKTIAHAIENVRSGLGGPFAALVVRDGTILATGTNQVTSSFDPTAHAEIVAIRRACQVLGQFELGGCEIYCSCEPCLMCIGAIYWARATCVYFGAPASASVEAGFDDTFINSQMQLPYDRQQLPIKQISHEDCLIPFQAWTAKKDRILY